MLERADVAEVVDDDELFQSVASHRRIFFRQGGDAQSKLRKGELRIVPDSAARSEWKADFEQMRDSMFFGSPPSFEQIIESLENFESRFNAG